MPTAAALGVAAVLLAVACGASTGEPSSSSCPASNLVCANNGTVACPPDAPASPCSDFTWERTSVCDCPAGYGGSQCEFATSAAVCADQGLALRSVPRDGDGRLECSVVQTARSKILNLIDQSSQLMVDLAQGTVTLNTDTRLKGDRGLCSAPRSLLECKFSQCNQTTTAAGDGITCKKKACTACQTCGIPMLKLFVGMLNADKRPLLVELHTPDDYVGEPIDGSMNLQTALLSLPLSVQCRSGYCAAA